MNKLSVSIVVYKENYDNLKKLLASLYVNLKSFDSKVFVLDNSPTDDFKIIKKDFPDIEYIFNNANFGYGAAHNIAIKKSIQNNVKYHLVLNPDVTVNTGTLNTLYDYMEQNPNVGLVMPKVLYPDGELQYLCKLLPSPFDLVIRRFLPKNWTWVKKRTYKYEMRDTGYDKIMEVPSLSGCFMFMRTNILKEIGGFDTRYFMYLEDLDLCRRIGAKYKTIYYPHVHIVHAYNKGSYKNLKLLKFHIVSAIKYFNKWGWF